MTAEETAVESQANTEVAQTPDASTQPAVETQQQQETPVPTEQEAPKQKGLLSEVENSAESGEKEAVKEDVVPEEYEAFVGDYLDEQATSDITSLAKEKKLTQDAANIAAEGYNLAMKSLEATKETAFNESMKAFKSDPKGQETLVLADKAAQALDVKDYLIEQGYDQDYRLMQAFAAYGEKISEDKVVTGETSATPTPQSPYKGPWN